jgi:hypothetical protein
MGRQQLVPSNIGMFGSIAGCWQLLPSVQPLCNHIISALMRVARQSANPDQPTCGSSSLPPHAPLDNNQMSILQ